MFDACRDFSLREKEILKMMAKNYTNIEISERLFISVSSVKCCIHQILEKLRANGRVHASVLAIKYGIIDI